MQHIAKTEVFFNVLEAFTTSAPPANSEHNPSAQATQSLLRGHQKRGKVRGCRINLSNLNALSNSTVSPCTCPSYPPQCRHVGRGLTYTGAAFNFCTITPVYVFKPWPYPWLTGKLTSGTNVWSTQLQPAL